MTWENTLRSRLDGYHGRHEHDGTPVSIKIRSLGGCFDRGCCPAAHRIIDDALRQYGHDGEFGYEKHESGPELLVYLALGTATITLAKSVIDLVTTIIKARSEGQKQGDRHHEPLELIVRGFDKDGKMFEERVLRIDAGEEPTREAVQKALTDGLQKRLPMANAEDKKADAKPQKGRGKRKR